MSRSRITASYLLPLSLLCMSLSASAAAPACQIAEPAEKPEQHQHTMQMNVPDTAGQKCDPHFTYTPGPNDPEHWSGECNAGKMQSPIDITHAQRLRLAPVIYGYRPADLKIFNDCNHYQVKVLFPTNKWLFVGKKPYFLSELHFHEPGEHAINGKRAAMVIHLVHLSPESTFLVVEVPVVVGKENPSIQTLWEHIPHAGKEQVFPNIKINALDLLPDDRDYYRLPGSLTTPLCGQGVTWFVLKKPIEISQAQLNEYKKHYHDTARPLQPANDRPIAEPFPPK